MFFTAFTDESYIDAERYRSICVFSLPTKERDKIENEISQILKKSSVKEFKWKKVKDAKYKFCAISLFDFVLDNIAKYTMRVDVIIWDIYDSRHDIRNRDDAANFERMFFHLLKSAMKRRDRGACWEIYPDERMGIDWDTVKQCLGSVGSWQDHVHLPLFGDFLTDPYYRIETFQEANSCHTPGCQIADLFAGICVFSKTHFDKYMKWRTVFGDNLTLFPKTGIKYSNREKFRFEVIQHLNRQCKSKRLGVSLKTNKGFSTRNPQNQLNFWHYLPQHGSDKAPTRTN